MKNPFRIKIAKQDFTSEMMPKNRRELFFDILKLHWQEFILYGFIALLFALPYHFFVIFEDFGTALIYSGFDGMTEQGRLEALEMIRSIKATNSLMTIPCLIVFGIFLAGILRVVRQFSWMENMYFRVDFFSGIKQNVKQTLLICLVFGVLQSVCVVMLGFSYRFSEREDTMLMLVPTALLLLIIPIFVYSLIVSSIYSGSLMQSFKVGVILFSKNMGKTYLAYILSFVPFVFLFIPNMVCHLIGAVIGSLVFPFLLLGWYLLTLEFLDKDINPDYFPELLGRGIFKPEDDVRTLEEE